MMAAAYHAFEGPIGLIRRVPEHPRPQRPGAELLAISGDSKVLQRTGAVQSTPRPESRIFMSRSICSYDIVVNKCRLY
jgi:hypothetical protein